MAPARQWVEACHVGCPPSCVWWRPRWGHARMHVRRLLHDAHGLCRLIADLRLPSLLAISDFSMIICLCIGLAKVVYLTVILLDLLNSEATSPLFRHTLVVLVCRRIDSSVMIQRFFILGFLCSLLWRCLMLPL